MFSSKIKNTSAQEANAWDYREVWRYLAKAKPRLIYFLIQYRSFFFFPFSPIKIKNASVQGGPALNFTAEPLFDRRSGRREDGRPTSSGSSSVSNMTRRVMYFNMLAFPGERL